MPGQISVEALKQEDVEDHTGGAWQAVTWQTLELVSDGPGVYAWYVRGPDEGWYLMYVGMGARRWGGLRYRLRSELGWVRAAAEYDKETRKRWFSAHPRTMARTDGQVWCWPTETAAEARKLEAELLELSVLEAAAPPLLNGKAWWSDSLAAVEVRRRWEQRRAARHALAS